MTRWGAGTLRIFAPDILPDVEKAIIVDTGDVVLLDDIANLWAHFDNFGSDNLFGAGEACFYASGECLPPPRVTCRCIKRTSEVVLPSH